MKAKPAGNTLLANHILFFANDKMEEINVDLKQWKNISFQLSSRNLLGHHRYVMLIFVL
jgi:hypothetical protein